MLVLWQEAAVVVQWRASKTPNDARAISHARLRACRLLKSEQKLAPLPVPETSSTFAKIVKALRYALIQAVVTATLMLVLVFMPPGFWLQSIFMTESLETSWNRVTYRALCTVGY